MTEEQDEALNKSILESFFKFSFEQHSDFLGRKVVTRREIYGALVRELPDERDYEKNTVLYEAIKKQTDFLVEQGIMYCVKERDNGDHSYVLPTPTERAALVGFWESL
ncbi:MAG: hypothetical protein WCI72_01525 [archaeon]